MALAFWSTSWNGPPIADGAATCDTTAGGLPVTRKITVVNSTPPVMKAARTRRICAVRCVIGLSEAGDEAAADRFEENGRAVVQRQRRGCGDDEARDPGRDQRRDGAAGGC